MYIHNVSKKISWDSNITGGNVVYEWQYDLLKTQQTKRNQLKQCLRLNAHTIHSK